MVRNISEKQACGGTAGSPATDAETAEALPCATDEEKGRGLSRIFGVLPKTRQNGPDVPKSPEPVVLGGSNPVGPTCIPGTIAGRYTLSGYSHGGMAGLGQFREGEKTIGAEGNLTSRNRDDPMGPEVPQVPIPDSDEGILRFEKSGRWNLSLKAILALMAIGVAFLLILWILEIL